MKYRIAIGGTFDFAADDINFRLGRWFVADVPGDEPLEMALDRTGVGL